ncbi:MAG: hypothetical protein ACQETE_13205 [Bacteroidota bacterium]
MLITFSKQGQKRPIVQYLLFVLLLGCFSGPLSAQAQQLRDYLTVDSLRVGDSFTFAVTLNKDQLYDAVQFPDSSHFPSDVEINQQKHYKITEYRDSVVYHLQFFGSEDTRLESLPVRLILASDTTTLYTTPAMLRFTSVLDADDQGQFKPLKPIYQFARNWWPWLLGALILAGFSYWGYLRSKKYEFQPREEPIPVKPPPPFENPLEQLQQDLLSLKESDMLLTHKDFDAFYVALGDAIRTYLERVYSFPALESTTTEIIREMRNQAADNEMLAATRKVLQEADMVKFARFEPTMDQAFRALNKGEQFIQRARELDKQRIRAMERSHQQRYAEQAAAYKQQQG